MNALTAKTTQAFQPNWLSMQTSHSFPATPLYECGSPDRTQTSAVNPYIAATLERALPGINAGKLFQALDTLLGGRDNYTLVGSACMHLHALEYPNGTCQLPQPNDLDVVLNDTAIRRLDMATPEKLNTLNLKRDADFRHVLHMPRENQADLKIDMVHAQTPGFFKYQHNPHSIHGVQVGMLADCMKDYKSRQTEHCDTKNMAWSDYFDQFNIHPATKVPRYYAKRKFEESPSTSPVAGAGESSPEDGRKVARVLTY